MNETLKVILSTGAVAGAVISSVLQAVKQQVKLPSWGCILFVLLGSALSVVVSMRYFGVALEIFDMIVFYVVVVGASQGVYFVGITKANAVVEFPTSDDIIGVEETETLPEEESVDDIALEV